VAPDPEDTERIIELYESSVELSAVLILREAAGWGLLSAGWVDADKLWGEFERLRPE
jgi:hypothetical protein